MAQQLSDWFRRVAKDIEELITDNSGTFVVTDYSDDGSEIEITLRGPDNSPFEGGSFYITFKIPPEFPSKPLTAYFATPVWHPNISSAGTICVDFLERSEWARGTTLLMVVEGLRSLLSLPNPHSPLNMDAGAMLINNPDMYRNTVLCWSHIFAGGPNQIPDDYQRKLTTLQVLNDCTPERALRRLSSREWDVDRCHRASARRRTDN